MPKEPLTRAYLETLSFSDLAALADGMGIDVPEHLNRSFLIGDLLEASEEGRPSAADDSYAAGAVGDADDFFDAPFEDDGEPVSYTATEVAAVLRNPAWAFVFWSISDRDALRARQNGEALFLRAFAFADAADFASDDFYDIQISENDTSEYILCPQEKKFLRVELVAARDKKARVLASSKVLELPRSSRLRDDMRPGRQEDMSAVMELSGMRELLLEHYRNHRESFS